MDIENKETKLVKAWITEEGYQAVILLIRGSHHCGYIGTPKEHRLYGKHYSDSIPKEWLNKEKFDLEKDPYGKRSPMAVFYNITDEVVELSLVFNVHGSLTFAGEPCWLEDYSPLWFFGFDCAHIGDVTLESVRMGYTESGATFKEVKYVEDECNSLSKQLKERILP